MVAVPADSPVSLLVCPAFHVLSGWLLDDLGAYDAVPAVVICRADVREACFQGAGDREQVGLVVFHSGVVAVQSLISVQGLAELVRERWAPAVKGELSRKTHLADLESLAFCVRWRKVPPVDPLLVSEVGSQEVLCILGREVVARDVDRYYELLAQTPHTVVNIDERLRWLRSARSYSNRVLLP